MQSSPFWRPRASPGPRPSPWHLQDLQREVQGHLQRPKWTSKCMPSTLQWQTNGQQLAIHRIIQSSSAQQAQQANTASKNSKQAQQSKNTTQAQQASTAQQTQQSRKPPSQQAINRKKGAGGRGQSPSDIYIVYSLQPTAYSHCLLLTCICLCMP